MPRAEFDLEKTQAKHRLVGIWRMLKGYRVAYLAATISLGVAAVSKTGTYILLRYFSDNILGQNGQASRLPWIAFAFIGLALFEGIFTFFSGRLAAYTAEGISLRNRNFLFDHIQRLRFSYFDKMQTGELIQRCTSDVDAIRRFFSEQAIGVGRVVILFLVNFIAIYILNARLALISVVVIPLIVLVSIFFFRKVTVAYEAYQEQDAILSTRLQENLTGVRVVKAFARQGYEIDKFNGENWKKFLLGRRLLAMHSGFWPISDILCGIQLLAGFTTGAIMAINGTITVGTYLAYSGLVVWLIFPMRNLGRLIVQTSTGLVSYGRIMEIASQEREPLTAGGFQAEADVLGEIVFEDVSFEYETGVPILEHISFRCKPGQSIALLGSTGSGKTSLVNLLPRFYDYSSGNIWLDGIELKEYPRSYLRDQIGIVEQEPFLFSRSIRENITYGVGHQVTDEEIRRAARFAAIDQVILGFPQGYNTLIGEKGVTLSGGQKQRVAIARTLLRDPRILILDDATSSVDTETEAEIRSALLQLMAGRTSFIITHRIQSVLNADLILVMDKGRIVQSGTHSELFNQQGIYRKIFDIQTRIETELEQEISSADLSVKVQ
ncbi:MAG: ABC transporter ATP-binding protein [Anaerolineales bacterium]